MGRKEEESPGPDQACISVSSLTNYPWGPVEERSRDNGPTGPLYQPRRASLPRPSLRPQIQREHGGTCCHIAPSLAEGGPWAVPPGALVPPPTPHLAGAGRSGYRRASPFPLSALTWRRCCSSVPASSRRPWRTIRSSSWTMPTRRW